MPSTTHPTIYFSIDYRSPPSGMGQIVDTTLTERVNGKWNMTLVDYGDTPHESEHYTETKYFFSKQAAQEGWAGPVIEDIVAYLKEQGVTHVRDTEVAYEYPGADEQGYFTLERWADIYLNPQW